MSSSCTGSRYPVSELVDVRSNMKPEFGERNVEEPHRHALSNTYSEADMAKFNRIEVHFDTPKGRHRAIVLPASEDVQAIFIGGAESQFLPGMEAKRRVPPEEAVSVKPDPVKLIDGPGVCYLINGELHCW